VAKATSTWTDKN